MRTLGWMRSGCLAAAGVLLIGVVAAPAAPAAAAAPANDSITHAVAVTGVPSRLTQGTAEATSSSDDGECVFGASVWYRLRASDTETVRINTVGSGYDTVVAVFEGPAASRSLVSCNDDAVALWSAIELPVTAGTTYWIAVSACCYPAALGGDLVLSLYHPVVPAAPTARVTSAKAGRVSGRLFLTGTVACRQPFAGAVNVAVSQRVGAAVARGFGYMSFPCTAASRSPWSMTIDSETSWAFRPGRAAVTFATQVSDGFVFATTPTRTVTVRVTAKPRDVAPTVRDEGKTLRGGSLLQAAK